MSLRGDLIKLAHANPELQPKLLPVLKESMTRGETYPDVQAAVHDEGITLSIEVQVTGAGMELSTSVDRLKDSMGLIRKMMNGGLMNDATKAAGANVRLGKFYVGQGKHPWLVSVHTLLYMGRLRDEQMGALYDTIGKYIKPKYLGRL